jgi:hypothetical protein
MLTRLAFFEDKIQSGHEAGFDRYVRETLLPTWRQTPHALRVEVMHEVEADDGAHCFLQCCSGNGRLPAESRQRRYGSLELRTSGSCLEKGLKK